MLQWAELCKLYLEEAKWYNSGYTPTFQEYMDNAWICMDFSGNTFGISAYIFTANPLTDEAMECLLGYPNIVRWAAMIVRLVDDLGTSSVLKLIFHSHISIITFGKIFAAQGNFMNMKNIRNTPS